MCSVHSSYSSKTCVAQCLNDIVSQLAGSPRAPSKSLGFYQSQSAIVSSAGTCNLATYLHLQAVHPCHTSSVYCL